MGDWLLEMKGRWLGGEEVGMVRAPSSSGMGEFTHIQGRYSSLAHLGPMGVPDPLTCRSVRPLSMVVPGSSQLHKLISKVWGLPGVGGSFPD